MRFCGVCDNMMYIRTTPQHGTAYACKMCDNTEAIEPGAVVTDTKLIDDSIKYTRYVTPHLKDDVTLPHVANIPCPNVLCSRRDDQPHDIVVVKYDYDKLQYLYMCAYCDRYWLTHDLG